MLKIIKKNWVWPVFQAWAGTTITNFFYYVALAIFEQLSHFEGSEGGLLPPVEPTLAQIASCSVELEPAGGY
jgi:hypothetical protein